MTTLGVILDDMLASEARSASRYTEDLTRALIAAAPRGCNVEGFVSASTEAEYDQVTDRLPGLVTLHKSSLARRELTAAWAHGFTRLPGTGMLHAPSLLAPLARHDRLNNGDQIAVTVHDTIAWSNPESMTSRRASWHKSMLKRAERYADAIVVPSHAVAAELLELTSANARIRVISGAPSTAMLLPKDADERAQALGLPDRFVLAIVAPGSVGVLAPMLQSLVGVRGDVPLVVVGLEQADDVLASALAECELGADRVKALGALSDADLAVVVQRASVFLSVAVEEGWGMPVLEAFALGTPVVHFDSPGLVELADGAGIVVEREPTEGFTARVAEATNSILDDIALSERLTYSGLDRAKAFTWRSAAEKVWQLHADL